MTLIEVENLSFKYEGRKLEALSSVNLRVEEGETVLLLGPSGSGKSTLALCLNGLIPQTIGGRMEGSVHVAGLDTRTAPVSELTQRVGVVFQDPEAQFVTMTVEDEVAFGLENLCVRPEEMNGRIGEALALVGMEERRWWRVDALSGGYKQRLALGSLLAMRPGILIFDEPTANLDPVGTREFFEAVESLKQTGGFTIVLIEHKLDPLMPLIDRVVALAPGGKNLADGPPDRVFRDHAAELLEHGIWMPQTALLAHRLKERGVTVSPFPVTLEAAARALEPLSPKMPGSPGDNGFAVEDPGPPAVEVRDLSFAYDERQVLDGVNLRVPRGDFLAVVGANGAGKTTLAQHLMGVLRPPPGTVMLGGRDVGRIPARELVRRIGYVFQNPEHQFITDTVEHELGFGSRLIGVSEEEVSRRVGATLERFALSRYARANPFTLSHGEKRRLSVATMLVVGQSVLILDEPTFGQDQRNAEALMQLMHELHTSGQTIMVITHDMTLVAEYARNVAVLSEGSVLYHGPTEGLFVRPELLKGARLEPPPLAELSRRLAAHDPAWGGLLTLDDFLGVCGSPEAEEVRHAEDLP